MVLGGTMFRSAQFGFYEAALKTHGRTIRRPFGFVLGWKDVRRQEIAQSLADIQIPRPFRLAPWLKRSLSGHL